MEVSCKKKKKRKIPLFTKEQTWSIFRYIPQYAIHSFPV
ncbi:hypothetical protein T458_19305 [Brevibacillus panacihumi W25]|uniref:Uncharacterized protein n=1 Tax=Brevibacillus panacihumi W25 TaxID=1408254 RepID=V6M5M1_9BACL|nr:hypothetical protein T458_19305 [Brevibacillus panacihumi W25]